MQMFAIREVPVLEEVQLEQRVLDVQRVEGEGHHQHHTEHEAHDDRQGGEAPGRPDLGQGVDERGQAGGEETEAERVEGGGEALVGVPLRQPAAGEDECDDADR